MIAGVNGLYWLLAVLISTMVSIWYYWQFFKQYFQSLTGNSTAVRENGDSKWWFSAAILRFLGVFLLVVMFFNPWWTLTSSKEVKPTFLVYIDTSYSMDSVELKKAESWIRNELKLSANVVIKTFSFGSEVMQLGTASKRKDNVEFDKRNATAIAPVFDHLGQFKKHSPVSGALVVSDGIINKGMDPDFIMNKVDFPLYFIGTGDPKVYPDVTVKSLLVNDQVLVDGVTPVEAQILSVGFQGGLLAELLVDGQVLSRTNLVISQMRESQKIVFEWIKKSPGRYRIDVRLRPLQNEKNTFNNTISKLVQVIENKKRVLLLTDVVDPDISAIRRSLKNWDQFELIIANGTEWQKWIDQSDIVLLRGLKKGVNLNILKQWQKSGKPIWLMVTGDEDVRMFSDIFAMDANQIVWQEVQGGWNEGYSGFTMDGRLFERIKQYPPLQVPMISMSDMRINQSDILMWQRWSGNLTQIPMHWVVRNTEWNRLMVSLGRGFWRWRIAEFKDWSDFSAFDQWFRRSLMVLNAMVDKPSPLEIQLSNNMIDQSQTLLGRVVYREADGKVNSAVKIALKLFKKGANDANGELISLSRGDVGQGFKLNPLLAGEYRLLASVNVNGKIYQDEALVVVNEKPLELLDFTARHQWMQMKSRQTGGEFAWIGNLTGLSNKIAKNIQSKVVLKVEEKETYWWKLLGLMAIVVCVFGAEWALRKWLGKY